MDVVLVLFASFYVYSGLSICGSRGVDASVGGQVGRWLLQKEGLSIDGQQACCGLM